jgi:hypothetical protein
VGGREGLALGFSRVFLSKVAVARKIAVGFRSSVRHERSVVTDTRGTSTSVKIVEWSFRGAEADASLLLVTYRRIGFLVVIGSGAVRLF